VSGRQLVLDGLDRLHYLSLLTQQGRIDILVLDLPEIRAGSSADIRVMKFNSQ